MIVANIFDFIDGKVALITGKQSEFGAFWDSTLDRFSDLALFTGLIYLYSRLGRHDYVLITTLTLIFAIDDELRARAGRVARREVQGRLHGAARADRALHDRRVHQPHGGGALGDPGAVGGHGRRPDLLHLSRAEPAADAVARGASRRLQARVLLDRRAATLAYDLWVIAILAFVWLTPPAWIGDPMATGPGLVGLGARVLSRKGRRCDAGIGRLALLGGGAGLTPFARQLPFAAPGERSNGFPANEVRPRPPPRASECPMPASFGSAFAASLLAGSSAFAVASSPSWRRRGSC